MKLPRIYIFLSCVVVITTSAPTSEKAPSTSDNDEDKADEDVRQETLEDLVDLGNEEIDLPILPPIILIDFTNGTNLTSEEKSKRTINGNLGYGFQRNNVFSGKYNYYFPAGKSGTTVSIEESISPFLPTTIIEKVNPVPEKLYANPSGNSYSSSIQSNPYGSDSNRHRQSQIGANGGLSVFGQRTKLHKSTGDKFQSFSRFAPAQKPNFATYSTPKPDFRSNSFSSGLGSYANPTSVYEGFSTPRPTLYNAPLQGQYNSASNFKGYNSPLQSYGGFSTTISPPSFSSLSSGLNLGSYGNHGAGLQSYSTPRPQNYNPSQSQTTVLSPLGNSPKYSYEDGIKYEHKIVWKYPDGKVSEVGPPSYDNSYSGYSNPTKISLTSNFQNPAAQNNFPKTLNSGYSVNAGSIYSQKPATFPDNGASAEDESKANQFVSSASISNGATSFSGSATRPAPPSQKYSFQNDYSVNGNGESSKPQSSASSGSTSYKTSLRKPTLEESKVISSYPVDSPEAEYPSLDSFPSGEAFAGPDAPQASAYTYGQTSSISNTYSQPSSSISDSTGGKIQSTVLTKYTPQVQSYLKKALGLGESGQSQSQSQEYQPSNSADSYSNIQYSSLLDYNPSISQYVRDPSSILNAQPTFVQAGNSLIPVIILRVDGVAPIQPRVTPNINLKALLQKYLTQYAQTVNDLSQGKNFDQGYETTKGQSSSGSKLFDIGQLTQSLGQLGRGSDFKQNFDQNFAQQFTQDYEPSSYSNSYLPLGTREAGRKPKVKNVEIVDDPRFTGYKVKN